MSAVKCLGGKSEIASLDEAFNELDHVRGIFENLVEQLTDEEHWAQRGAGDAVGEIVDRGLVLALANERLERLIETARTHRRNDLAAKRLHAMTAKAEG